MAEKESSPYMRTSSTRNYKLSENQAEEILDNFTRTVNQNRMESESIAALETLMEVIRKSKNGTMSGLLSELETAVRLMVRADVEFETRSVSSACEQFKRFITYAHAELEDPDFKKCREVLLTRGDYFINKRCKPARGKIVDWASTFLGGSTKHVILTHSRSRLVLEVLKRVSEKSTVQLQVFVTQSMPDQSGLQMCQELKDAGINAIPILDSAVAYTIENYRVQVVLLGAAVVCQNGGMLNKIGSYNIAVIAEQLKVEVYVVAETFKITEICPMNSTNIPAEYKYRSYRSTLQDPTVDLKKKYNTKTCMEEPLVDYVKSSLIMYFFTEDGPQTPIAVCDYANQLYNI